MRHGHQRESPRRGMVPRAGSCGTRRQSAPGYHTDYAGSVPSGGTLVLMSGLLHLTLG